MQQNCIHYCQTQSLGIMLQYNRLQHPSHDFGVTHTHISQGPDTTEWLLWHVSWLLCKDKVWNGLLYLDQVVSESAANAAVAQLYQLLLHHFHLLRCSCTANQVSINVQLCHVIDNDRHLMKHA